MTNEERWTAVYQRFDPEPSAILDHADWRAERAYSPLPRMRKQLRLDRFGGDRLSRPGCSRRCSGWSRRRSLSARSCCDKGRRRTG